MSRKLFLVDNRESARSGFSLIEILVVVTIVGFLASMVLPAWGKALARWQVFNARQQLVLAIRKTQTNAQRNHTNWQFSIYEVSSGHVQWASHPQNEVPTLWTVAGNHLIDIDLADTTLDSKSGIYYIRFDYKGNLASRTRTLTLTHQNSSSIKRCLIMSTILGKIRLADEREKLSSSGRLCY
ncbi:MAG: type II secretion system protein [Cyanobacteria bacterium P01_D01_bin.156]